MSVMFTTCLRGSREPGLPDGYGALVEKSMGDYDSDGWKRDRWGPLMSAVSIGHGDTVLRDQLIEDLDRLLPA
jgi:hypothetical protein